MAPTMCRHIVRSSPAFTARAHSGFTLVELLVVVSMIAVLLTIAVPSMGAMLHAQKATSLTHTFLASLHLARSEAIKRSGRAVLCKSADKLQCSSTGGWEQGWIVFHDANNNAQRESDELLVQQQGAAAAGLRLRGNMPVAVYVSYSASGAAKLKSGAFQAGTFTLCPVAVGSGDDVRLIVLGGPGRPRIQKGTAAHCV